ncbi:MULTISPECIES: hypothetical protein [unclassified Bradyrhizobium]|nr:MULTISPECIES: hypothetical protein [unclassified Bradyrhizobium]MCK1497777.1 hypothetical protein [Bradyrhizobium sp. 188]UPJ80784.1 hypothetical protein IVB17_01855 [Bradyrhizobium sp. 184]UPJ88577.1 hypothetical protein IVB16_01855 [Bradyrhizobium sp. 183]
MKQPASPSAGDGEHERKPSSRSEEARRIVVEEYAKDLAQIINRLRAIID